MRLIEIETEIEMNSTMMHCFVEVSASRSCLAMSMPIVALVVLNRLHYYYRLLNSSIFHHHVPHSAVSSDLPLPRVSHYIQCGIPAVDYWWREYDYDACRSLKSSS